MAYQNVDLTIDDAADYAGPVWSWLTPAGGAISLVGYSATMMVRQDREDSAPLLTLTSPIALLLGGTSGTVQVLISRAQVNAIVASLLPKRLQAFYDLPIVSGLGVTTRFSEGRLFFDRSSTR